MSGHTVLMTGAGFSKPAGGPLLRELLTPEFLRKSEADPETLDAIASLQADRSSGSIETLFTEILRLTRRRGKISTRTGERWEASLLHKGLTTHLASVCGDLPIHRRTRKWNMYTDYLSWLRKDSKTLTVITFNYDLLLEHLLDDLKIRFEYGKRTGVEFDDAARRGVLPRSIPSRHVHILKLHGSSNWGVCRGCRKAKVQEDMVVAFEKSFVPKRNRTCPRCEDKWLESGIVPPIIEKSGESRHTGLVWGEARQALRRAREIIVIGYSLPESDKEAVDLLQEIVPPPLKPRITLVCGPKGAPEAYSRVLPNSFNDAEAYFEGYVASLLS